jgi:hypothetical protein
LCTRKQKITYQATKKTIELRTQKHKIANQIATKNNNLNHTKIARKNTHNHIAYCKQQKTHTQNQTPKLQQKTQNHIVPNYRKKTQRRHRKRELGAQSQVETQSLGGSLFNVC